MPADAPVPVGPPAGSDFAVDATHWRSLGIRVGFLDRDGRQISQEGDFGEKLLWPTGNISMRVALLVTSGRFYQLCIDVSQTVIIEGPDEYRHVRVSGLPMFKPTLRKLTEGGRSKRFYRLPAHMSFANPIRNIKWKEYVLTTGQAFEPVNTGGTWVFVRSGNEQFSSTPTEIRDILESGIQQ
jgi:hypothetical protein